MEFVEYEKMSLTMDRFQTENDKLKKEEWVVLEKIHGSNFGCYTDGIECRFARRRDFLKENEGFYGYKDAEFMRGLSDKMLDIFKSVQSLKEDSELAQVIIFGEVFGGKYDHPDVPKTRKIKPVQLEIQYCPDIKLYCYDIAYKRRTGDGDFGGAEFLDYSDAMAIFDEFDLFYAKPLFTGKMNEALNYQLGFDSVVPGQLGLPALPKGSNKAEGIVVKPLKNIVIKTAFDEMERVIIKIKIPEFDETRNQKGNKKKGAVVDNSLRPDKSIIPIMIKYITENRMVSAVSKIGQPDTDELKKAAEEEFMEDVIADMLIDDKNNTLWESCNDKQKEVVRKCLKGKTNALLNKYIDKMANIR